MLRERVSTPSGATKIYVETGRRADGRRRGVTPLSERVSARRQNRAPSLLSLLSLCLSLSSFPSLSSVGRVGVSAFVRNLSLAAAFSGRASTLDKTVPFTVSKLRRGICSSRENTRIKCLVCLATRRARPRSVYAALLPPGESFISTESVLDASSVRFCLNSVESKAPAESCARKSGEI